jgi:hypothetical protein
VGNQYDDIDDLDLDDLDDGDPNLVKKLRKQLTAAQKQLKEQERREREWAAERHEATIRSTLSQYGLNPNIARYVPDDVTSEQELAEWLDIYGEDFGVTAVDEYDDDPNAQATERMNSFDDDGDDSLVGYDQVSRMEAASTPEDVLRIARGF